MQRDDVPGAHPDPGQPGSETWADPRTIPTGGGGIWTEPSYDPETNLVFYGTANPGPWNPDQRPGANKWTSTLMARDADTGELVWAFQMNEHDEHDYDGVNESILLDVPWKGQTRKGSRLR